jgi:hypothetical protein
MNDAGPASMRVLNSEHPVASWRHAVRLTGDKVRAQDDRSERS